jgi:hypothetical protein
MYAKWYSGNDDGRIPMDDAGDLASVTDTEPVDPWRGCSILCIGDGGGGRPMAVRGEGFIVGWKAGGDCAMNAGWS